MSQVSINNVMMNNNEKIKECIDNLFLLFIRRKYIDSSNDDNINKIINDLKSNGKSILKLNQISIGIYYKDADIKNISSGSDIDDFISKDTDMYKFIILKVLVKKFINKLTLKTIIFFIFMNYLKIFQVKVSFQNIIY